MIAHECSVLPIIASRLQVSRGLREREPAKPVVIAIHPHGVASDYRVAMDGLLYEALPGREV